MFLGIFQRIAPALNQCIYCLLEKHIQQEKHVPQLKERMLGNVEFWFYGR
jgi:hypothetical protein